MKAHPDIASARMEYNALPDQEWRKDFFSEETGGFLVTSWKRIEHARINKKEDLKFQKEHEMCLVFAKSGLKIKHYEDEKPEGSYDVVCNGRKGDLKRTKGAGNIVRYAKYATQEQGAEIVLFEFEVWNSEIRKMVDELVRKDFHGFYYISGIDSIHRY